MKLTITGRNIEITRAHRGYIRKRFAKWSNFLSQGTVVHITLSVESYRHRVEVTAKDSKYSINGKQTTKDMNQSIDLIAEKITRQLSKQHEKLVNKSGAARGTLNRVAQPSPSRTRTRSSEPEIEVELISSKPMSPEEAALQLKSTRKNLLVFEDAESGQLAVMTKEKNGIYKLITKE